MSLNKPKSITITIADRKQGKYESFVVYNHDFETVERKIKKLFDK